MAAGRRPPPQPGGGGGRGGGGGGRGGCSGEDAVLRGRFSPGLAPGAAAWALALTERELQVLRPDGTGAALPLADCVGSAAFPSSSPASSSSAACFSVVCYPFRKGRWGSPARQRLQRTFRVAHGPDAEGNLRIAQAWSQRIRELSVPAVPVRDGTSYGVLPRPCRALVLLNPQSGAGRALDDFHAVVQPMLADADIAPSIFITERPHHAQEKMRDEDLSQWDTLVVMSGDGLLHEVVNGLMERPDWEEAMKKPLCILPGGSGNALAASINYYAGNDHVAKKKLLTNCTFILCKGLHTQMDLVSLSTASGKRFFSFLGFGWGFIADVDIDSEKYRRLGNARFTLGTLQCLARLRVYQGRLSYLPAAPEHGAPPAPRDPPAPGADGRALPEGGTEGALPADSLLVPLGQPVPASWAVVPEEEFVCVYAIYQSHLGTNLLMAPAARLDDGCIHLFYVRAGISRVALLKVFLAMGRGTHLDLGCPHLHHVPVRAFRLEPRGSTGVMTVDGEALACEPVQGQVHGRLGRIVCGS
ncbi:sphingosine kinase 1 isoform X1 [Oxyura jamaicensis]|uniref:sphingosine kinase 1 isoform X1 n=1 Tax=Oxyura jamaicensis TaxID=8884 RepID=UPI0015A6FA57|nr:sphingosine kinase 1 isoform X1 [Oxyura jamaicensis]